ncbi:MAG: BLUF domain-containing protein, partial [Chloroflexota bacterium]
MTLVSLVYVSYATEPMSGAELEALMAKSSANNKPLGVTGMLLYRQGFFIQVLEGEEDVVMPLYEK